MNSPYDTSSVHRLMLSDPSRLLPFKKSLSAALGNGGIVADIGAGTGVLSLYAAFSGATHVFAIEPSPIARLCSELVANNNLNHKITVIEDEAANTVLEQPLDLIVSECMGLAVFDEPILNAVLNVKRRFLKPNGAIIPRILSVKCAMAWIDHLEQEKQNIKKSFDPFSCDELLYRTQNEPRFWHLKPHCIKVVAPDRQKFDLLEENDWPRVKMPLTYYFDNLIATSVNALVLWFEWEEDEDDDFTTSPFGRGTAWSQLVLPLKPFTMSTVNEITTKVHFEVPQYPGRTVSDIHWQVAEETGRVIASGSSDLSGGIWPWLMEQCE